MTQRTNPYLGPEYFTSAESDLFFGRKKESADLPALVSTERLLLYYAPSGAGKTSMLNARLIPALKERLFEVLPSARVSGAPVPPEDVANIYVYNLALSLARSETRPERFAALKLSDLLWHLSTADGETYFYDESSNALRLSRPKDDLWPRVLILDQFEEIITTYPGRFPDREDFFRQLDEAMRSDPMLRVVLVLRADFVQELNPYAGPLQAGMRTHYHMLQLGEEDAYQAIVGPAAKYQRPFDPDLAKGLLKSLKQIRIRDDAGQYHLEQTPWVEPVQLQVVCYQLWEEVSRTPGERITAADIREVARRLLVGEIAEDPALLVDMDRLLGALVDGALAAFYERAVAKAMMAAPAHFGEATLRNWFSTKLITESGTRGFALRGREETAGAPEVVVKALDEMHILRSDRRGDAQLVELVHDRFVAPIREVNERWQERRNLQFPWVPKAKKWYESGESDETRDRQLLLRDEELKAAVDAAKQQAFEPAIEAYLEESRRQDESREQKRWLEEEKQKRKTEQEKRAQAEREANLQTQLRKQSDEARLRLQRATWVIAFAALLAVIAAGVAVKFYREAKADEEIANQQRTIAQKRGKDADEASDLAGEAARRAESLHLAILANDAVEEDKTDVALALALHANRIVGRDAPPRAAQVSLMNAIYKTRAFTKITAGAEIYTVAAAITAAGQRLALIGGADGGLSWWDLTTNEEIRRVEEAHTGRIWSVALSPDGRLALSGGADGQLLVWNADPNGKPVPLAGHQDAQGRALPVFSVAFNPKNAAEAISAGADNQVRRWNLQTRQQIGDSLTGHTDWVYSVAYSPDGRQVVSGSEDHRVILWDLATGKGEELGAEGDRHTDWVRAVAFSPDGKSILSASRDAIFLWSQPSVQTGIEGGTAAAAKFTKRAMPVSSDAPLGMIYGLAFAPDGASFFSAGSELRRWNLFTGASAPYPGHTARVRAISVAGDIADFVVLSGSLDGTAISWDTQIGEVVKTLREPRAAQEGDAATVAAAPIPQACSGGSDYGPIVVGAQVSLGRHDVVNGSDDWNEMMQEFVGRKAIVSRLDGADQQGCLGVRVDIDDQRWFWRIRNLTWAGEVGGVAARFNAQGTAALDISTDGFFLAGAVGGRIDLWDRISHQWMAGQPVTDTVKALVITTAPHVIFADAAGVLHDLDLGTGERRSGLCHTDPARVIVGLGAARAGALRLSSTEGVMWVCDVNTGESVGEELQTGTPIAGADFSPDDRRAVLWGATPQSLEVWNLGEERREKKVEGVEEAFDHALFLGADQMLLVDKTGNVVKEIDLSKEDKKSEDQLMRGSGKLFTPTHWRSTDGQILAVLGRNGLFMWNPAQSPDADAQPIKTDGFTLPLSTLALASGSSIIAGSFAGELGIWPDLAASPRIFRDAMKHGPIYDLAVDKAGTRALAAHADGALVWWHLDRGSAQIVAEAYPSIAADHPASLVSVALSADGAQALSGGFDGRLIRWRLRRDALEEEALLLGPPPSPAWDIAISPDTRKALSAHGDGSLYLWDLTRGEGKPELLQAGTPDETGNALYAVAFDPLGFLAVSTRATGEILLWDIGRREVMLRWSASAATIALFSADGSRLLTAGPGQMQIRQLTEPIARLSTDPHRFVPRLPCTEWQERYELTKDNSPQDCLPEAPPSTTPSPLPTPSPGRQMTGPKNARVGDNQGWLTPGRIDRWSLRGIPNAFLIITVRSDRPASGVADAAERLERGKFDVHLVDAQSDSDADPITQRILQMPACHDQEVISCERPRFDIEVAAVDSAASGGYTLSIARPRDIGRRSEPGAIQPDERSYWTLEGRAGEVVRIALAPMGFDSVLELRDEGGRILASDDDSLGNGGSLLRAFRLPRTATYLLVTRGYSATAAGSYELSVQGLQPRTLAPNATQDGQWEDNTLWTAAGKKGEVWQIALRSAGQEIDPSLRLLGPSGNSVAENDDARSGMRDSLIAGVRLPAEGEYQIVPAAASGLAGAYRLTRWVLRPLPYDGVAARSGSTDDPVVWTFTGRRGEVWRITLDAVSRDLDPYLLLLGPEGQSVASNDSAAGGSLNAAISAVLPADGEYLIVPAAMTGGGEYTLRLAPAEPRPLASGVADQADTGDGLLWSFTLTAESRVRITMNKVGESGLDSYLTLIGPEGQTVVENDDGGGNYNALIETTLPPGNYVIFPKALGAAGRYELRWEALAP